MMEDPLTNDEESPDSSSSRRIWKRHSGSQGSSQLALKAMAVLYDAGQPLSRDELAGRLLPRLDTYARWYLAAWYQRRLQQQKKWDAKRHGISSFAERPAKLDAPVLDPAQPLKRWLTEIFAKRIHDGSLIRDPDKRFRPGPKVPRAQTMDGMLVKFTPEKRRELEQADHDRGRTHLTQLEFQRAMGVSVFDFTSLEARAQLVMFLVRRLFMSNPKFPLSERKLKKEFNHLVHIADTPAVKEATLRLAMEYLFDPKKEVDE